MIAHRVTVLKVQVDLCQAVTSRDGTWGSPAGMASRFRVVPPFLVRSVELRYLQTFPHSAFLHPRDPVKLHPSLLLLPTVVS